MAELDRDPRVSAAYRALGAERPPPEIDAAILAAARRRPVRWGVPVSIAAVVVLAVGVVMRVAQEPRREPEPAAVVHPALKAPAAERKAAGSVAREAAGPAAQARDEAPLPPAARAPAPAAANIAQGKVAAAPETPEHWLERIAKLRAEGRSREADESFAEFRRRYPDYRIPDELRRRIAPR